MLAAGTILHTSYTMPENKTKLSAIDDFFSKLLTSEKLAELAEKIAEKAANKIIQNNYANFRHGGQIDQENLNKSKDFDNNKDIQSKINQKPLKPIMYEINKHWNLNNPIKRFNDTFDKEFIKTDYKIGELSLNFKNLMKKRKVVVKDFNKNNYIPKENVNPNTKLHNRSYKDVRNAVNRSVKDKFNNQTSTFDNYSKDTEDMKEIKLVKNEQLLGDTNIESEYKMSDEVKKTETAKRTNIKNYVDSNKDIKNSKAIPLRAMEKLLPIDKITKYNNMKDGYKETLDETGTTKRLIRKEGNKTYSYNSSSDYKEYHEILEDLNKKMSRVKKKH